MAIWRDRLRWRPTSGKPSYSYTFPYSYSDADTFTRRIHRQTVVQRMSPLKIFWWKSAPGRGMREAAHGQENALPEGRTKPGING